MLLLAAGSSQAEQQYQHPELTLQQEGQLRQAGQLLEFFEPAPSRHFSWPLEGRITSRFGWRNISVGGNRNHSGIDVAGATGTPVQAARAGTVSRTGWVGAYGYAVYLDHGAGMETRYAHFSAIHVTPGQTVRQGEVLGAVGSSGAATGPHLHFEIRQDGVALDPEPLLTAGAQRAHTAP